MQKRPDDVYCYQKYRDETGMLDTDKELIYNYEIEIIDLTYGRE